MGGCKGGHVFRRIGSSVRHIIAIDADDAKAAVTKVVAKLAQRTGKVHDERAVIAEEYHQKAPRATDR